MAHCPHCSAPGELHAVFWDGEENGRRIGGMRMMSCRTCGGTHEISQDLAERIAVGKRMRDARRERKLSMRVAAEALGIEISELSHIEAGREPKTEPGWRFMQAVEESMRREP